MSFGTVLDVVIGLSVIYLAASLFVTIVNEYINQFLNLRAKQLVSDLHELISDPNIVAKLKTSPTLGRFFGPASKASSFVDTKILAQQIVGGLQAAGAAPATLQSVIASIDSLPASSFKDQLLAIAKSTSTSVEKLVDNVGTWLDQSLTMMGEAYKRWMQIVSFGVGFAIATALNLDTLSIVTRLYHDEASREAMASYGTGIVEKVSPEKFNQCAALTEAQRSADPSCAVVTSVVTNLKQRADAMSTLPIGYPAVPIWTIAGFWWWLACLPGWFMTGLATALGAPFWFGLLNRVVNIRHSMPRPDSDGG